MFHVVEMLVRDHGALLHTWLRDADEVQFAWMAMR